MTTSWFGVSISMGILLTAFFKQEIQKHEMVSNAFLLMLGGSETSSTALSAATYFLTSHPEALSKLTQEVLSTFQTEEEINVNTVQNLPYMLAVLDETLRLNPPLPHTTPRVVHKGGDTFCGFFVPEGVSFFHATKPWENRNCKIVTNHLHRLSSEYPSGQCITALRTSTFPTRSSQSAGWGILASPVIKGKAESRLDLGRGTALE